MESINSGFVAESLATNRFSVPRLSPEVRPLFLRSPVYKMPPSALFYGKIKTCHPYSLIVERVLFWDYQPDASRCCVRCSNREVS
jgi:hypothetical protein